MIVDKDEKMFGGFCKLMNLDEKQDEGMAYDRCMFGGSLLRRI